MQTSATPQPSRLLNNPRRNSWESEIWDDMANTIFSTTGTSLTVPMPIAGRLQIMAMAQLAAAGALTISVDGNAATSVPTLGAAGPLTAIWTADVAVGNHTVTIASGAGLTQTIIIVRRGRKPPSV